MKIQYNRKAMLKEFLYALLGVALVFYARHIAINVGVFTINMATVAFIGGILGALFTRSTSEGFIAVLVWLATLTLFGIGISTYPVAATLPFTFLMGTGALLTLNTDCIVNGYGVRTTPFLGSSFVAILISIAICL